MDSASLAKRVVESMGGGSKPEADRAPKGITIGHVTAMERFQEASSATEKAAALKDFIELVMAEAGE